MVLLMECQLSTVEKMSFPHQGNPLHYLLDDPLVDRSGVDSPVDDWSSVLSAKAGDGGLWVWAWLAGANAYTSGWGADTQHTVHKVL